MELTTWVAMCLIFLLSGLLLITRGYYRARLPPGPRGLPLIGCPWALFSDLHLLFAKMAETWGDVVSINIMGKTIVALNSTEAARDTFGSQALAETFSGRPAIAVGGRHVSQMTVFLQPGPVWSKLRKIVHKTLNHYGEGLYESERTIQGELTHVIEKLEKAGNSVNMDEVLYLSLINIATILLQGRRYDYDSPVLANVRLLDEAVTQLSSPANSFFLQLFPFFRRLNIGPGKLVQRELRAERRFLADYYEESKATYSRDVSRGMIDVLLRHQEETGSSWMTDEHVKGTTQEMITAGVMTSRGALYSFFLIILHHPMVMSAIQDEIQAVIGDSRFPKLQDRSQMPYTNAAILELLRYTSHVPFTPRQTTDDVIFHGYVIPKHTMVLYNSWCFHHDSRKWKDPWEFRPQRFLDEDGHLVGADHPVRKNLMPFGSGRRTCAGETFAKSRIFLYLTTLLQRFHFKRDPARPPRSCDPRTYRPGLVLSPYEYWVTVTPRS